METCEQLMRRVVAAVNERDYDRLRQDLSTDIVHHTAAGDVTGIEAVIDLYRGLCEDAGWKIAAHEVAATAEWGSVIHRNDFDDASFEVTTSGRVRDGRLIELWTVGQPPLQLG